MQVLPLEAVECTNDASNLKAFRRLELTMARPRSSASGKKKEKLSVTPDPDLLAWVRERTGPGKEFSTLTHAVERGWAKLREAERARR